MCFVGRVKDMIHVEAVGNTSVWLKYNLKTVSSVTCGGSMPLSA